MPKRAYFCAVASPQQGPVPTDARVDLEVGHAPGVFGEHRVQLQRLDRHWRREDDEEIGGGLTGCLASTILSVNDNYSYRC